VLVKDTRAVRPSAPPAREPKPEREVDVLPVGEERFVEAAGLAPSGQSVGGRAPARAERLRPVPELGGRAVPEPVPGAKRRVELDPRRVHELGRVVLEQDAGDETDAVVRERLQHPFHEVRLTGDIVVEEDHDGRVDALDSAVHGTAEAEVLVDPDHPHRGEPLGNGLRRPVGRRVVDHDHVVLDRLAREAGKSLQQQHPALSRRDHDGRSHAARYANLGVVTQGATDLLSSPEAGGRVVRGGLIRGIGFGVGVLLAAGTSALLLRHLGVHDFGRYGAVAALLGIVSGVGDAGLTAIGARELSLVHDREQSRLMRNLVTLRLLITPVGILGAVIFAAIVYPSTMVWGTLLGGLGVLLVNTQATMMMPLSVELRLGTVAAFEVAKTALTFVVVLVLVVLGSSLLPFFGAQIPVGALVLAATPFVVPVRRGLVPGFDRRIAVSLLREALPMAIALTMNVVYFRVLMIMVSLIASSRETGYFATSFQVFAVIFSLPLLVLSSALPLLSVAGRDDGERLRFGLQRMTEVSLAASVVFVLAIDAAAPWAIPLLGGDSYKGAVPVLQIQAFALIPVFVGQVWQLGLLSLRRQSALTYANAGALLLVVALGAVLIPLWAAEGAAVAAVLAETGLAALVYVFLRRASRAVAPRPGLTPRIVAAALPAFAVLLLPLRWEVKLVASVGVFLGAATVLRAIPRELFHALRTR